MSAEVVGVVGAVLGAVVAFLLSEVGHRHRERRERQRQREQADAEAAAREERQINELHHMLSQSKRLFDDQAALRDRLVKQLRGSNPTFRPSKPGFEYLFKELFPVMTPDERTLHGMIAGYSDRSFELNRQLQAWLIGARELRTRWAKEPQRQAVATLLEELEQHLDGWFVKYRRFNSEERERALVYLADEDRLGPRFPTKIDGAVKELVEINDGTRGASTSHQRD